MGECDDWLYDDDEFDDSDVCVHGRGFDEPCFWCDMFDCESES